MNKLKDIIRKAYQDERARQADFGYEPSDDEYADAICDAIVNYALHEAVRRTFSASRVFGMAYGTGQGRLRRLQDGLANAVEIKEQQPLVNGEPCEHPGCLSHVSHPCEGCGRIAGRYL